MAHDHGEKNHLMLFNSHKIPKSGKYSHVIYVFGYLKYILLDIHSKYGFKNTLNASNGSVPHYLRTYYVNFHPRDINIQSDGMQFHIHDEQPLSNI